MSRFIQLHLLTSYPPSNLNRDDLNRPKTAIMGGATRLRVSSQSLKRAWRKSELFESALADHIGVRTKTMGVEIFQILQKKGIADKKAIEWTQQIAGVFGKLKSLSKKKTANKEDTAQADLLMPATSSVSKTIQTTLEIEQLAHFSPEEQAAVIQLAETLAQRNSAPTDKELNLLRAKHTAVDIALFGRMLASAPAYNMEAAAQIAHAISVHEVAIEDDFFTAIDDLNQGQADLGAAHMGETEFAAGLYYLYICIDHALLTENLNQDQALVKKTLAALIECAAKMAPTGKQNSFASRAYSSYILAEKGDQQPRSLSVAFLKPVTRQGAGMLNNAVTALEKTRDNMNQVYGECAKAHCIMNAEKGKDTLDSIIQFVTE